MGLLDDLKKQAEAVKAKDNDRTESLRACAVAVDESLRRAFLYLNDLAKQLNIVQMPCPFVFKLPATGEVPGLVLKDFFADYRTKSFLDKYYCSDVHVAAHACAEKKLTVTKGPNDMERFRDFLWQHNIEHKSEQMRDERRIITQEVFEITCDFRVLGEIEGDHETGKLRIRTRNVGGFEADVFQIYAPEFDGKAVEEFAKYFIGRPNEWAELVKGSPLNRRVPVAAPRKPKAMPDYVAVEEPPPPEQGDAAGKKRGLLGSLRSIIKRDD